MKRIAIIGGGISGLTAAYELELARQKGAAIDWHLYEASHRLGGIIQTTRIDTPEGRYILEGGPDGWVTEKPWARDLAIELGLESELIDSNDATRKTYILKDATLQAIPDAMRMMVPTDLAALEGSPLFSASAKAAYAAELTRAEELTATSPQHDESVADFVRRHFGEEVLTTLAAPLLSGVFGGDVNKLSVRAVMPQFVRMEQEHGSLIAALQASSKARGERQPQPIFTSLRNGIASLTEALTARLPQDRLHLNTPALHIWDDPRWQVILDDPTFEPQKVPHPAIVDLFDHVIFTTSVDTTKPFLAAIDYNRRIDKLLPTDASSAILVAMTWPADLALTFTIPQGFGFLVPQTTRQEPVISTEAQRSGEIPAFTAADTAADAPLLACTFVDQKFPHRSPAGARILRAFFGGPSAEALAHATDETITHAALTQLREILGPIPDPIHTHVRRLPRSLPQYEVGHQKRIAQLEALIADIPGLTLLGNAYRGVGLPDLIRDARSAARRQLT